MSLSEKKMGTVPKDMNRRDKALLFIILGILMIGTPSCSSSSPAPAPVIIVTDGTLGKPAEFGVNRLLMILEKKGQAVERADSLEAASSSDVLLVGTLSGSTRIKELRSSGRLDLSDQKESLAVKRFKEARF